ncbi:RNA polymerase sigma-70 factor [Sphingobacterium sp. SYP-B4668]|uniref:RNA polymerase sigma-70 factor n=1 Tax=Sphingobacterium sp. SYP-B4668 TaxID=2996035 RepID=UPI0022DE017B|nr:RNA polymerase sigma-70 factor [Sphingobacterium sp. SYP-B4668]
MLIPFEITKRSTYLACPEQPVMDIDQAPSERDTLLQLQNGDMQAFGLLYRRYSRVIYGNILRLVHDEVVAEDLLQDVFVKIWEHRALIDPERSFTAYLFTCSRNLVFNFKRRLKLEMESAIQLAYGNSEGENTVDRLLDSKETQQLLEIVINRLPTQRQKIFRLCKMEGMSYQEVADQLDISVSTVRDHIVKANKFIKEMVLRDHHLSTLLLVAYLISIN